MFHIEHFFVKHFLFSSTIHIFPFSSEIPLCFCLLLYFCCYFLFPSGTFNKLHEHNLCHTYKFSHQPATTLHSIKWSTNTHIILTSTMRFADKNIWYKLKHMHFLNCTWWYTEIRERIWKPELLWKYVRNGKKKKNRRGTKTTSKKIQYKICHRKMIRAMVWLFYVDSACGAFLALSPPYRLALSA